MRKWRQEQAAAAAERKQKEEGPGAMGSGPVKHRDSSTNPQMTRSESVGASLESRSNNSEKKEEKEKPVHPPLFKTICTVYGVQFLFGQFVMFVYVFVYYINPCLLWSVYFYQLNGG